MQVETRVELKVEENDSFQRLKQINRQLISSCAALNCKLRPYIQERDTFTAERETLQSAADAAHLEGAALREELAAAADAAMAEAAMAEAAAMARAAAAEQSLAELKVGRCKLKPGAYTPSH